ncbi:hypothetical protein DH2020_022237 [Rehmannia glutinosa]|uniref:PRONE domain-containing protein n=1 Tax=Rehmannia glutinosa TaxID=99300 RepID=A0ABR0WDA0_REHGL
MESEAEKSKKKDGSDSVSDDSVTESRDSSRSSSSNSRSSSDNSSPAQLGWPIRKAANCSKNEPHLNVQSVGDDDSKLNKQGSKASATVFGQLWRLEPLPSEKKSMWKREMEWLLCVSDHIVEMIPSWQTFPHGSRVEVMTSRPRSDLIINLPALRKLDNMLLEILDGFTNTEFWYVDQGIVAPEADGSVSLQKAIQRQEDKWWLPVPRVPPGGLPEGMTKQLSYKLECASQILKAATAINSIALAEMEVPESYLETLPKNGRACLGDVIYRYITSDHFSSECLLDCLDLSSEHAASEMANRVEAAIYVWSRRQRPKPPANSNHSAPKSSWGIVRDLMIYGDKRELLAERAESLLLSLKQRFPGLTQTTLDTSKIQFNKDVGKSILESYSRVLESLAFNIMARIDDLLYVDNINKQSDKLSSVSLVSRKKVPVPYSVPVSGTPYRTAYTTPTFSPAPLVSPAIGEKTPFLSGNCNNKPTRRGLGVKRVLTNYLGGDAKVKNCGLVLEGPGSVSNRTIKGRTTSHPIMEVKEPSSIGDDCKPQLLER